jgi:nucleoredoxin
MSGVIQLFDDNIYDKNGNKVNSKSLPDKTIGIYFAAKWCSVCVKFTPILVDFYKRNRDKLNMEIIFVSSDHDEDSFDQYYNEMPWLCLKFSERQLKVYIS